MSRIINSKNKKIILDVIKLIKKEDCLFQEKKSTWVLIGSYVINQETEDSDIDLLFIHSNTKFLRFKKEFLGINVSVCAVPLKFLKEDGEKRKYGGYFSAKCLNPFEIFYEDTNIVEEIYKSAGSFIGKLAGYIALQQDKDSFTADEVTAQVFSAYISLHSGYISYFLSYFTSPIFEAIWAELKEKTMKSLTKASVIQQTEDTNRYIYIKTYESFEEYHNKRLEASSFHWSFGSIVHNSDPDFPYWYYKNAETKINSLDPEGSELERLKMFISEKLSSRRIIY
jgi:predicted nucleotidyltransferase